LIVDLSPSARCTSPVASRSQARSLLRPSCPRDHRPSASRHSSMTATYGVTRPVAQAMARSRRLEHRPVLRTVIALHEPSITNVERSRMRVSRHGSRNTVRRQRVHTQILQPPLERDRRLPCTRIPRSPSGSWKATSASDTRQPPDTASFGSRARHNSHPHPSLRYRPRRLGHSDPLRAPPPETVVLGTRHRCVSAASGVDARAARLRDDSWL
jgi:hypothetical protein